jgi:hypothetical protein
MKTIFQKYDEAKNGRHVAGETGFLCACCNIAKPTPEGLGTGYAVHDGNRMFCYECSDKVQREELRDRKPTVAYLSGDGKHVTTWTGGNLMRVLWSTPCRLTRHSWMHGNQYRSIRARDSHGAEWIGRGSPGIAIRLRPVGKA